MLKRKIALPPEHLYPADEWRVVEARYSDEFVDRTETVYSLGNGFVGIRGSFEEGRPGLCPGTFVNGFHETWPIVHAEGATALARTGQTIVNVPDTTILKLYVDDEPFFLPTARVHDYARILDMRAGTLTRELVWATGAGKHVRIRSRRLVSLEYRHLVAMTYEVTMLDQAAPIAISSLVLNRQDARHTDDLPEYRPADPRLATVLPHRVLNPRAADLAGQRILLGYQTTSSRMTLSVGVDHVLEAACPYQAVGSLDDETGEVLVTADAQPGVPIRITKYATYQSSPSIPVPELLDRCRRTLDRAVRDGFDSLVTSQRANLDRFWDRADVRVEARHNPVRQQQAIRWNLYQVAQASWRAEGAGVPAKGLTGQAYEGHYFWDTEIYVLPFMSYTQPKIARNLLRFRHSESWERAAATMHVPFDEKRGIHPQDDTFLERETWDLDATPREKFPLLLHYHPLVIYRHQVLKQADIVLAMFLLGNEFSEEQKRRNFDYYDPITTGDSSLSACVQSIVAAETGKERQALEYFQYAVLMDLGNVAGNASDGVHIASAAGVWSALVFGFGGVRDFDGRLSFAPNLPRAWNELAFSLRFCGRQLRVKLTHDEECYFVEEGAPLDVTIRGESHMLSPGSPVAIKRSR